MGMGIVVFIVKQPPLPMNTRVILSNITDLSGVQLKKASDSLKSVGNRKRDRLRIWCCILSKWFCTCDKDNFIGKLWIDMWKCDLTPFFCSSMEKLRAVTEAVSIYEIRQSFNCITQARWFDLCMTYISVNGRKAVTLSPGIVGNDWC